MKRILITGANSYIGTSFEKFMSEWKDEYEIDTLDLQDDFWRKKSFEKYDVVYHVAGIAHRRETKENAKLYYRINCDLTLEVAKKAKKEKVKQFIYLSSGTVYGTEVGVITPETNINPKSHYAKSKAQAEAGLKELVNEDFIISILRPLMVYGKGCKGNFQTVIKLVKRFPVFPRVHNERSLIYIDNLSSFVKLVIDEKISGVLFPKDETNADIAIMAEEIALVLEKKVYLSKVLGLCIKIVRPLFGITQKAFGSKVYQETETFGYRYCVYEFREAIRKSV